MFSYFEFKHLIIFYRGPSEVTKQAHTLIIALIDDPELDITQILPKPSKPVTSCGSWEKTNTVCCLPLIKLIYSVNKIIVFIICFNLISIFRTRKERQP